jgi:hypothetical protein
MDKALKSTYAYCVTPSPETFRLCTGIKLPFYLDWNFYWTTYCESLHCLFLAVHHLALVEIHKLVCWSCSRLPLDINGN